MASFKETATLFAIVTILTVAQVSAQNSHNAQANVDFETSSSGSGLFSGMRDWFSQRLQEAGITKSLVDIGPSRVAPSEGRHVGVNVPLFFNMDLDTRGKIGQSRLNTNALMGLVHVERDRVRGQDGKLHGPIKVRVAGIPMFYNNEPAPSDGSSSTSNGGSGGLFSGFHSNSNANNNNMNTE
ncbi:hypothetical protein GZH46_01650 [Fragariocoptes setiger]|uniref:Uncharacterized protein n=1 Tax=Fragariocoptes setiger TaxID=1670756 RepID=A0ABQ7S8W3_9ACAR|nr:hypothetical protein GZH46_01650 [Fragariocoptes setiger]